MPGFLAVYDDSVAVDVEDGVEVADIAVAVVDVAGSVDIEVGE